MRVPPTLRARSPAVEATFFRSLLTAPGREHIMNKLIRSRQRRCFERQKRSAERCRQARGERGPGRGVAVERREAPHPYVTGVRAPSPRRAADRVMVRQGALAERPAPPGAPFPSPAREKEKREGASPAPEIQVPGQRSVGCLTSWNWVCSAKTADRGELGSFCQKRRTEHPGQQNTRGRVFQLRAHDDKR